MKPEKNNTVPFSNKSHHKSTARTRRMRAPRGSYEAQRWLAAEEAEELKQQIKETTHSELSLLYHYALYAFSYAVDIVKIAISKEIPPTEQFVAYQVRLSEYLKRLMDIDNLYDMLKNLPKNPATTFGWQASDSALKVAIEFSEIISGTLHFAHSIIGLRGSTSYYQSPVSPVPDQCFTKWCEQTIQELNTKLNIREIWPSMGFVHRDYKSIVSLMKSEYRQIVGNSGKITEARSIQQTKTRSGFIKNENFREKNLMEYDVFICHASEDKKDFVKPLADAIVEQNLKVWYDEFELTLGDSLREKIDYGLTNSRYGLVVLSEAFFAKKWPQEELDGLVTRQTSEGRKVILPIWNKVGYEDVKKFSPMLAGKVAARSEEGLEAVVAQILTVCREEGTPKRQSVFQINAKISLREKCLEIIREDDAVAWRELVENLTNEVVENLMTWKQTGEKAISQQPNLEPWRAAVLEAVKIAMPSFVPILAAIQVGKENYWRESTAFLRSIILLYEDMGSGTVEILRIGNYILYAIGSIGMALAAKTKQLHFVKLWAGLNLPESGGTGETAWCQTYEVNYWKTRITGKHKNPYGFFMHLLEFDDIKSFFGDEKRFEKSLFIGNLLHSLIDFQNSASQPNYEENLKSQYWKPHVMPIWCLMKSDDFRREIWRIFGSSAEIIKFAYPGVMPSTEKFWVLWQAWKKKCVQFMSDGGHYHTHLAIYLYLPGEPEIRP